jgi:hypothetical protein
MRRVPNPAKRRHSVARAGTAAASRRAPPPPQDCSCQQDSTPELRRLSLPTFSELSCDKEVSSPSSGSTSSAFCHLSIDSLPHSATHIGDAQSGMVQWGFVITIKRRVAIARTLSVLQFASHWPPQGLAVGGLGAHSAMAELPHGRAIDQCQFHRPLENLKALGRRLGLTVLAASAIPIRPPGGHCRSQGEDQAIAGGDRQDSCGSKPPSHNFDCLEIRY